jgi:hypothetical protein
VSGVPGPALPSVAEAAPKARPQARGMEVEGPDEDGPSVARTDGVRAKVKRTMPAPDNVEEGPRASTRAVPAPPSQVAGIPPDLLDVAIEAAIAEPPAPRPEAPAPPRQRPAPVEPVEHHAIEHVVQRPYDPAEPVEHSVVEHAVVTPRPKRDTRTESGKDAGTDAEKER